MMFIEVVILVWTFLVIQQQNQIRKKNKSISPKETSNKLVIPRNAPTPLDHLQF